MTITGMLLDETLEFLSTPKTPFSGNRFKGKVHDH